MGTPCFAGWLAQEVESAQTALLARVEQLDTLRYVEDPRLRSEYMAKIGTAEEEVLQAELDARMLQRKLELIQIRINRREPVDLAEIDRQIEEERKELLAQTEAAEAPPQIPALTAEEQQELQTLYHKIVENFHPQVHPDLTETEKALYEKAAEAYRSQNLAALRLIGEILCKEELSLALELSFAPAEEADQHDCAAKIAELLSADYTLARQLYPCFAPLQRDAVLQAALERFTAQRTALEAQIEQLQQSFPFSAAATLQDPEKTKAYLAQLQLRKFQAEERKQALTEKLTHITEELPHA